jgi:dTDP-4-dehydrorhamnose reductase
MIILVTGSNGQLGNEIRKREVLLNGAGFIYADLPELDITDKNQLKAFIVKNKVTTIVNCAAYTAVDKAEGDEPTATLVNVTGPENIATLANHYQLTYIHISTDFVFDGRNCLPYSETDQPNPLSVYGQTKREGEIKVLEKCSSALILRTSWLYSVHGNNFVKTIQRLGKERESLNVIFDQIGSPTWAGDLAEAILRILADPETGKTKKGIYHFSNEGVASWYDFAVEILDLSGITCTINPIETKAYPTPAMRPYYSVLNKAVIKVTFGLTIPHWKKSLKYCVEEMKLIQN